MTGYQRYQVGKQIMSLNIQQALNIYKDRVKQGESRTNIWICEIIPIFNHIRFPDRYFVTESGLHKRAFERTCKELGIEVQEHFYSPVPQNEVDYIIDRKRFIVCSIEKDEPSSLAFTMIWDRRGNQHYGKFDSERQQWFIPYIYNKSGTRINVWVDKYDISAFLRKI